MDMAIKIPYSTIAASVLAGAAFLGGASYYTHSVQDRARQAETIDHRFDFPQLTEVTDTNDLAVEAAPHALIFFYQKGCEHSDKVDPVFNSLASHYDPKKLLFTRSDANKNPVLTSRLNAGASPRIAILEYNAGMDLIEGPEIKKYVSDLPEDQREAGLRNLIDKHLKEKLPGRF